MRPGRAEQTLGLLALLLAAGASAGLCADEPSAEEALAKLGLKQAGIMLVLDAESEVHAKPNEIRRLSRELSNTRMQQRGTLSEKDYQATLKELSAEITQFRSELNTANQRIAQIPRYRGRLANNFATEQMNELNMYKSQLQLEVNQRSAFLNQLKSQPFDPKARGRLDAQVQEQRDALQQATQDLRRLVDTTRDRYAELAKDPTLKNVQAALKKQNGKTFRLGPSQQFLADVKMLERLERMVAAADGGSAATGTRATRGKSKGKRTSATKRDTP